MKHKGIPPLVALADIAARYDEERGADGALDDALMSAYRAGYQATLHEIKREETPVTTDTNNPQPFTPEQLAEEPILNYFGFAHLPPHLQPTSAKFFDLACYMVAVLPRCAERSVALRKTLEAKDAAVRASIPLAPK